MEFKSWEDELLKNFNYCDCSQVVPYPSASPQFFQGYMIKCAKTGADLLRDNTCCKYCKHPENIVYNNKKTN